VTSALPELVVFDLAGTTVRDGGEVPAALSAALASEGIVVDESVVRRLRGASKRQAVAELLPAEAGSAARAERIYATFRRNLLARYAEDGVAAIDGAAGCFAWLRARGIRVALNTGFDREITAAVLAALDWNRGTVEAVVCGDDVARSRPAPDLIFAAMERCEVTRVERVANVGDTVRDLEAARGAGVRWNVGVLSGAHDRATLARAPHTHLLASVAELPALFLG